MSQNLVNPPPGDNLFSETSLQEMLFDRMPMGIAILDRSFDILRYNPTWLEFSQHYAPPDGAPLTPGVNYFQHLPGTEPVVLPLFERVLEGHSVHHNSLRLDVGENATYWDLVLTPLTREQNVIGILAVAVDVTARVAGQLSLEEGVKERTRELARRQEIAESLRVIISMINDNLPLDEFLKRGVKLAAERLEAAACVLHQFDLEREIIFNLASYGMEEILTEGTSAPFSDLKSRGAEGYLAATLAKQPTYTNYSPLPERVEEIRRNPDIPEDLKPYRIALRQNFAGSFSVPLFTSGEVYGGMVFYYREPQAFSEDQIQLGLTFAEQVGIAIENARLHETDETRRRELQILLDVAETANSSLDLEELLASTLDLLVAQLDISRSAVSLLDENTGYLMPALLRPERQVEPEDMAVMMAKGQEILQTGQMEYIAPNPEQGLIEPGALIPLQARGRQLGLLGIIGKAGVEFSPDQLALFKSIADQLGVAVENAWLFQQAEENAITTERNRLARDLHDAVTQTLFSSSLIADVLPKIWDRDPEEGRRRLAELRQLTRGALSEMRTLLIELRPVALADADMKDLINHLVNAFAARTRLTVDYQDQWVANPPPEIKEMAYRITQEAFNNIAKHADASKVLVRLASRPDHLELAIEDDGIGFHIDHGESEGLGLGIMQERAQSLGATLELHSEIGQGTKLRLIWSSVPGKEPVNAR